MPRLATRIAAAAVAVAVAAMALLLWAYSAPLPAWDADRPPAELAGPGDAPRGQLVFAAAQCGSCHAEPGQPDRTRLGGGLAVSTPFGTLNVPNISPHPDAGIGRWRTVDLANALQAGVSPDGRHYYPSLPYTSYVRLEPRDIADLMAYLRTLPPVAHRAPPHELPFPFNVRRLIGLWKLMFFDRRPFTPMPSQPPEWQRGRYLVEAAAHCGECHSSRNLAGAVKDSTRHAGGRDPEGTGYAPNITPTGLAGWQPDDVLRVLETGRTPDLRVVGSSMADVVANLRELPAADRQAIVAYVRTLRAKPTSRP